MLMKSINETIIRLARQYFKVLCSYKLCGNYYIYNATQVFLLSANILFAGENISMMKAIILLSMSACYVP